ncbi:MAG: phage regulatory CII family protein [Pseudomonadota bacterium]
MHLHTRPMSLLELVQATVSESREGTKGIAEFLGKSASTLYSEMNPNEGEGRTNHKLGLLDWVKIMRLTGDCRPLQKVAEDLGYVAVPLPAGEPSPLDALQFLTRITKEAGEHAAAVCAALEKDGRIDRQEARACLMELDDLLRAAVAWRQVLLSKV